MKNYHGVLDVPLTASQEEIRSQYKQLVRIYHPDRFTNPLDKVYAEEKLKEINEAYRALSATVQQTYESSSPVNAPRPVLEPLWLDFGILKPNKKGVRSFQVSNLGAPAKKIEFIYGEQKPTWFYVDNEQATNTEQTLPAVFEVTADAHKLAAGQAHHGWVEIDLDGTRARLNLTVRIAKATPWWFSTPFIVGFAVCVLAALAVFLFQMRTSFPLVSSTLHMSEDAAYAKRLQADHLLFAVDQDQQKMIYFSPPDGANQLSLGINGWSPVAAPNGRQIAYMAGEKNAPQIFISDVDGHHLRQVTSGPEFKTAPVWSLDGRMLAFLVGEDDQSILRIFDLQTNQFYDLPNAKLGAVKHFSWAPDSRALLFDAAQGDSTKLYQANANGQNVRLFSTLDSGEPAWSPDGKQVAVVAKQGIFTLDSQGQNWHQLNSGHSWAPAWSFDGTQIAFFSDQNNGSGTPDLWVMDSDGRNQRRITETGSIHFAWSPISKRLGYVTGNSQKNDAVLYLWITDLAHPPQLIAEVSEANIGWTR